MQDELKAVQEQLEALKTVNNAPNIEAQNAEWKEVQQKWQDSVKDTPELAVDYTNYQVQEMQARTADLIEKMQNSFDEKLERITSEMNPEKLKYRDKIDMLKQNPDFAEMDDGTIMKFIKATEKVPIAPRGTATGKRPTAKTSSDDALKAAKEKYRKMFEGQ
jgi:hypothetical protein